MPQDTARDPANAIAEAAIGALIGASRTLAEACHRDESPNPWRDDSLAGRFLLESYLRLRPNHRRFAAVVAAQGKLDATDALDDRACEDAYRALSDACDALSDEAMRCARDHEERADEAEERAA